MGVPESEVRIVEAVYERAKGRAVIGLGLSYELVNIILSTGSPTTKPTAAYHGGKLMSRKINTKDVHMKVSGGAAGTEDGPELMLVKQLREQLNIRLEEKGIR